MQIMQTDRSQAGRYTAAYVRFCLAHYRCDLRAPDRPRFPGACMGVRFEDAPGRRGRRAHGGFEAATAVAADIARALRALASDRLLAAGAAAIIWRGPGAVDADGRPRRWPGPGQTVPWAVIARRFRLARRPLIAAASDAVEWMARWLNGERMITPPRSQAAIRAGAARRHGAAAGGGVVARVGLGAHTPGDADAGRAPRLAAARADASAPSAAVV
ncbi:MAG: hypothetical protein KatS3mg060_1179 [Dehalococcoidia bacterium]|nr:MAG: hypothetical protein KatS3mg060_1179 [Dehalococcoidia bacterium]